MQVKPARQPDLYGTPKKENMVNKIYSHHIICTVLLVGSSCDDSKQIEIYISKIQNSAQVAEMTAVRARDAAHWSRQDLSQIKDIAKSIKQESQHTVNSIDSILKQPALVHKDAQEYMTYYLSLSPVVQQSPRLYNKFLRAKNQRVVIKKLIRARESYLEKARSFAKQSTEQAQGFVELVEQSTIDADSMAANGRTRADQTKAVLEEAYDQDTATRVQLLSKQAEQYEKEAIAFTTQAVNFKSVGIIKLKEIKRLRKKTQYNLKNVSDILKPIKSKIRQFYDGLNQ